MYFIKMSNTCSVYVLRVLWQLWFRKLMKILGQQCRREHNHKYHAIYIPRKSVNVQSFIFHPSQPPPSRPSVKLVFYCYFPSESKSSTILLLLFLPLLQADSRPFFWNLIIFLNRRTKLGWWRKCPRITAKTSRNRYSAGNLCRGKDHCRRLVITRIIITSLYHVKNSSSHH